MTPTNLDAVRELINIANNLIDLLESLLTTGRPQFAQRVIYVGVKFYLQMLVEQLGQIARELALEEIMEVVGNDFDGSLLSNIELFDRVALLPIIIELRDDYGVGLISAVDEPLSTWLSSSAANLALVDTVYQAVGETASELFAQISSWSDPSNGYLRNLSISNYPYLENLQSAVSPSAAFRLIAYDI